MKHSCLPIASSSASSIGFGSTPSGLTRSGLAPSGLAPSGALRRLRHRRGFSLLELVVVIGIIVLLAALVLAVGTGLLSQSEVRETRNAIQIFDAAIEEWERTRGRTFTYGTNGVPPSPAGLPAPQYDIQEVLAANDNALRGLSVTLLGPNFLASDDNVIGLLTKIDGSLLRPIANTNPTQLEFVDAWGNRAIIVFPGRDWRSGVDLPLDKDEDGTMRTPVEKRLGVCVNRKIRIVSSGPDGVIGDLKGNATEKQQAGDNVHSYEPVQP